MKEQQFYLPSKIGNILAALALKYKKDGADLLLRIISSQYNIINKTSTWTDGNIERYLHTVTFQVNDELCGEIVDDFSFYERRIDKDLEKFYNSQNESLSVSIELADGPWVKNWQRDNLYPSGPVFSHTADDDVKRLWGGDGLLRVFISHKSEHKSETNQLKEYLYRYRLSCFVAHKDIRPTKEWQKEITRALGSMQVMVALLTEKFHDSDWTDQEVGIAIGRNVPVVPVLLGKVPYGFIGKYQGVAGGFDDISGLAKNIFYAMTNLPVIETVLKERALTLFGQSSSYTEAMEYLDMLKLFYHMSAAEIDMIINAFRQNDQINQSGAIKSRLPAVLEKWTGRKYAIIGSELFDSKKRG